MATAHKSAISVGMIYVPVSLYKTTRDIGISFNQLCKDTTESMNALNTRKYVHHAIKK